MTAYRWQWTPSIVPTIGTDFLRDACFRSICLPDSRFTVGGVVSRIIGLSSDPLFVFATAHSVVACSADETARAAVAALLAAEAAPVLAFDPGAKVSGNYLLSSPGVTVSLECEDGAGPLAADDLRRLILVPSLPSFSASSLVNRIGDAMADSDWLIVLDQHSGTVTAAGASVVVLSAALDIPGIVPLVALNLVPES
jgi:hypothetical protein